MTTPDTLTFYENTGAFDPPAFPQPKEGDKALIVFADGSTRTATFGAPVPFEEVHISGFSQSLAIDGPPAYEVVE